MNLPPLPEKALCGTTERWFGQAQVEAYARQAQRMALEEAKKECESKRSTNRSCKWDEGRDYAVEQCITSIRGLANELEAKP